MAEITWIEEQKKNKLFRGGGHGSDADRMLQHGGINKKSNRDQSMKVITARLMSKNLKVKCLGELADMVEQAQLIQDGEARENFMRVAIEQWQGKLANTKNKVMEALL